jgi:hypothetical protein
MIELGSELCIVHVGTSPWKISAYELVNDGILLRPSAVRCSPVNNEHGSTPSNRTSRGRGGSAIGLGACGVSSATVVHPASRIAATAVNATRIARR